MMPKHCESCYYFGRTTDTCDFFYLTNERRGCPIDSCTRHAKRDVRSRQQPDSMRRTMGIYEMIMEGDFLCEE